MPWQDWIILAGFAIAFIEFWFIVGIYRDDRAMRRLTEEALKISRESLAAQKEYLALRRKWYESRPVKQAKREEKPAEVKGVAP
jgi:hypothetical protein